MGPWSVVYHPWVIMTLTLTSDQVSRICFEAGANPVFFEVGIQNLVCGCTLGWQSVAYHFLLRLLLLPSIGQDSSKECTVDHFRVTVTLT